MRSSQKTDDEELDDLASLIDSKQKDSGDGLKDGDETNDVMDSDRANIDTLKNNDSTNSNKTDNSMNDSTMGDCKKENIENIISREIASTTKLEGQNKQENKIMPPEVKVKEQNEDVEIENENEMDTDEK